MLVFFLILFFSPLVFVGLYRDPWVINLAQIVAVIAGSAVLGLMQRGVLRLYSQNSAWWIPVNVISWSIGWYTSNLLLAPLTAKIPSPDGTLATGAAFLLVAQIVIITYVANAFIGLAITVLLKHKNNLTLRGPNVG